jgi:hypothetical protein
MATPDVTLDTIGKLHEHGYTLACYCVRCRRWADPDLRRLVAEGRGDSLLVRFRPRCRVCGERGDVQLRPPVRGPAASGWIILRA